VAEQAIRAAVQIKENPADLINVALKELVQEHCELPGYTTPEAIASSIRAEVKGEVLRTGRGPAGSGAASRTGSKPRRRHRLWASSKRGWRTCRLCMGRADRTMAGRRDNHSGCDLHHADAAGLSCGKKLRVPRD
jgi:hypothetical protein